MKLVMSLCRPPIKLAILVTHMNFHIGFYICYKTMQFIIQESCPHLYALFIINFMRGVRYLELNSMLNYVIVAKLGKCFFEDLFNFRKKIKTSRS